VCHRRRSGNVIPVVTVEYGPLLVVDVIISFVPRVEGRAGGNSRTTFNNSGEIRETDFRSRYKILFDGSLNFS